MGSARSYPQGRCIPRAKKLADTHQEICSSVDRVLAYREAAIAIFNSQPPYLIGIEAVRRINLNTGILLEMLAILLNRPDLGDGALYSAVSGKRLAVAIVDQTNHVLADWGKRDPQWHVRKDALVASEELANMVKSRNVRVRKFWKLSLESSAAKKIRKKYIPLAVAIQDAIQANSGAPQIDLSIDYF